MTKAITAIIIVGMLCTTGLLAYGKYCDTHKQSVFGITLDK